MAKQLNPSEVDFRRTRGGNSWFDQSWLNGEPWLIVAGEDFTCTSEAARTRVSAEASAKNMGVRTKLLGNGDLMVQAYERTPEQMAAAQEATAKRLATRAANAKAGTTKSKKAAQPA